MDKILSKIKKLLALSQSSNPHEAATALEMARKLMVKYHIDSSDIKISSNPAKKKFATKPARYVLMLIQLIDDTFGVNSYICNYYEDTSWGEKQCHPVFFGVEERPIIASYCFDVLYRQLQSARKSFNNRQDKRLKRKTVIARTDTFCEGWVSGVRQIVTKFALPAEEKQLMETYIKKLEARESFDEVRGRSAGHTGRNRNYCYDLGVMEGKQATLNQGVGEKSIKKLNN